jgi:hypothetical protein
MIRSTLKKLRQTVLEWLPLRLRFALRYMAQHKRFSLLIFPTTFTEKLMLRIALDRREILQVAADKLKMRQYVADKVGGQYLPMLLCVAQSPKEINWAELPERFVVKANHGSGWVKVVRDKAKESEEAVTSLCGVWLASDYGEVSREKAYRKIKPYIIVEELIESDCKDPDETPWDFKCFVFNGRCALIQVDMGRFTDHRRNLYSPEWVLWNTDYKFKRSDSSLKAPQHLDQLIATAEAVGADLDFARVDLYSLSRPPFVCIGEITMSPGGGMEQISDNKLDYFLGSQWKLVL